MSGQSPLCARCKADDRLARAAVTITDGMWTAEDVALFMRKTPSGVLKAARDGRLPVQPKAKYPHLWNPKDWYRWRDGNRYA